MNSYTFVPKLHHLSSQQPNQPASSILQRLQQLKQSMKPVKEDEYSSVPPNSNPGGQYGSAAQNQRLFQYLPKETQQRLPSNQNQEGTQQYESYRKSLEKKLNYLFEKEKHIMKTQSTYKPLQAQQQSQTYATKAEPNKRQLTEELERKYSQMKKQQVSNLNKQNGQFIQPQGIEAQSNAQRQHRVQSAIETGYGLGSYGLDQKDEEIDQMERKIKMLEMKYLGGYSQSGFSPYQNAIHESREKQIAHSGISEIAPHNNPKHNKPKHKKEKNSLDKPKKPQTYQNPQNPTIQQTSHNHKNYKQPKNEKPVLPSKQKHLIKDYMETIQHQNAEKIPQYQNSQQSLLHNEFNELKKQFHALLQISKSVIQKVEISEDERRAKRENKQRAKAMLKEILLRLDEIKEEVQGQAIHVQDVQKTVKGKLAGERVKSRSDWEARFQKSSNKALEKRGSQKVDSAVKNNELWHKKLRAEQEKGQSVDYESPVKSINQIEKLKRLLTLQVQHRQIVERKLEVVYGSESNQ